MEVRDAHVGDVNAIASLLDELGYPTIVPDVIKRLDTFDETRPRVSSSQTMRGSWAFA